MPLAKVRQRWIAGIADIARHRRNRKGKSSALIATDQRQWLGYLWDAFM